MTGLLATIAIILFFPALIVICSSKTFSEGFQDIAGLLSISTDSEGRAIALQNIKLRACAIGLKLAHTALRGLLRVLK